MLSNNNVLSMPYVRTLFGTRRFSIAAHTMWNSLSLRPPQCVPALTPFIIISGPTISRRSFNQLSAFLLCFGFRLIIVRVIFTYLFKLNVLCVCVCSDKLQMSRKEVAHQCDVMASLESRCARQEDTITTTQAALEAAQLELRTSKAREDDLEEQMEAALSEVQQYSVDVDTLEQAKKNVEEICAALSSELERLRSENVGSNDRLLEKEREFNALKICCDEKDEQLTVLTRRVTELDLSVEELTSVRDGLQQSNEQLHQNLQRIEEEQCHTKTSLDQETARSRDLMTEVCEGQTRITELETELQESTIRREELACSFYQQLKVSEACENELKEQLEFALNEVQQYTKNFSNLEQEKKNLEALIASLNTEVENLKCEYKDVNDRLLEKEQEFSALKTSFDEKEDHVGVLTERVTELNLSIEELRCSRDDWKCSSEQLQLELSRSEEEQHRIKSLLNQQVTKSQDLETEVCKEQTRSSQLETELQESRIRLETLESSSERELKTSKAREDELTERLEAVCGELRQQAADLAAVQQEKKSVDEVSASLSTEVETLRSEIVEANDRLSEKDGELIALRTSLSEKEAEITDLTRNVAESKSFTEELMHARDDLQHRSEQLQLELSRTEDDKHHVKSLLEQEVAKTHDLQTELCNEQSRSAELEVELKESRVKQEGLQSSLKESKAREDDLKTQLDAAVSEVQRSAVELTTLEEQKKNVETVSASLGSELEELRNAGMEANHQLLEKDQEITTLKTCCVEKDEELAELTTQVRELNLSVAELRLVRDKLQQSSEQMQRDLSRTEDEQRHTRTLLQQEAAKSHNLQSQVSQRESRIAELETELQESRIEREKLETTLDQELKTYKAREDDLKQQLETAFDEIHQHSVSLAALEQEKKNVEEINTSLASEREQFRSEIVEANDRFLEKDRELIALKTSFDDKETQLTVLTERLTEVNLSVEELTRSRDDLQEDLGRMEEAHRHTKTLLDEEVTKSEDLQTEVCKERTRSAELETELQESRSRQEGLERSVATLEESVSANGKLQHEFLQAEEMVNAVKSQLEAEVQRSKELTARVDQEYLRSVELEGDLQLTRLKLEDAHTELTAAVSKNEELERLIAETNEDLASTRTQLDDETQKSDSLADKLDVAQLKTAEVEAELGLAGNKLKDLEDAVSLLETERDVLKEQLSLREEAQATLTQQLNQQVLWQFLLHYIT